MYQFQWICNIWNGSKYSFKSTILKIQLYFLTHILLHCVFSVAWTGQPARPSVSPRVPPRDFACCLQTIDLGKKEAGRYIVSLLSGLFWMSGSPLRGRKFYLIYRDYWWVRVAKVGFGSVLSYHYSTFLVPQPDILLLEPINSIDIK